MRDNTAGDLSCRERVRERGVALVEFTFVMPLLLVFVLGIIDFGLLFSDIISVRQGVRDGGRQAAVGKFGSDTSCPLFGVAGSNGAKALMCLTKSRDNVPDDRTRVHLIIGDGSAGPAHDVGKPITVCEQYLMKSISFGTLSPDFLNPFHDKLFTTRTVFRVDTVSDPRLVTDSGVAVVVSEDSFPQGNWNFCLPPPLLGP